MRVRVLGSGAGGGFPQWNCACPTCRAVRERSRPCLPRTQSSIAVGVPGQGRERWFLVNASPDISAQLEGVAALHPRGDRDTPVDTVLLTDAELDHTLGLLLLREGRGLRVHATASTFATLRTGTGFLTTLERYCPVECRTVEPGREADLTEGLTYRAFGAPTTKPARFESGGGVDVVGYRFTDTTTRRSVVYLPGVQAFTDAIRAEIDGADVLLVDGTCWRDDELKRLGLADKTAYDMGHLAVGDPGGSLDQLAAMRDDGRVGRVIYVHINNSNPMLIEDSPERAAVESRGIEVAHDGLEVR